MGSNSGSDTHCQAQGVNIKVAHRIQKRARCADIEVVKGNDTQDAIFLSLTAVGLMVHPPSAASQCRHSPPVSPVASVSGIFSNGSGGIEIVNFAGRNF